MVAESDSANIFKIGLLVFEILQNIPWIRSWKDFSNRTSRSKVMTKFQFICKCYAITCNTCKVHVYSFFALWFVHSKLCQFLTKSLQNFKGGRWQTNFRLPKYYVINIFKLEYLRYLLSDWDQTCFDKSRMTVSFIS